MITALFKAARALPRGARPLGGVSKLGESLQSVYRGFTNIDSLGGNARNVGYVPLSTLRPMTPARYETGQSFKNQWMHQSGLPPKENVDNIGKSIAKYGKMKPITIGVDDYGRAQVTDGLHRLALANRWGLKSVPAMGVRGMSETPKTRFTTLRPPPKATSMKPGEYQRGREAFKSHLSPEMLDDQSVIEALQRGSNVNMNTFRAGYPDWLNPSYISPQELGLPVSKFGAISSNDTLFNSLMKMSGDAWLGR